MQERRVVATVLTLFVLHLASTVGRAETHHVLRFLRSGGSPFELRTMHFSPDGSMLVVSTARNRLSFIRTQDGEIVRHLQETPFSIGYSKNGERLFMISESKRKLLDSRSGRAIKFDYNARFAKGHLGLSCVLRGGKIIVKEINDGGPAQKLKKIRKGDEITGIGEGRGGRITRVLGYSLDRFVKLLQGEAGSFVRLQVIPKGEFESDIHTLRRQAVDSRDGRLEFIPYEVSEIQEHAVWCMSDNKHEFSNAYTGEIISAFKPVNLQDIGQVAVSPDGKLFAILATRRDRDGDGIEIFTIASRERLTYAPFPGDSWYQIRFSADGSKLLIGTRDTVQILNIKTGKYEDALTLGWNAPDEVPRAGGTAGSVKRSVAKTTGLDINRSRKRSPLQLLKCLAVSSQNVVATADPFGAVRVWDITTGEKLREFATGHEKAVQSMEFSRDGKWFAYFVQGELHVVDATGLQSKGSEGEH